VYDFATVDLSSIYFDVLKDRLYTTATKSHPRRSAQTALYRLTHALVRLFTPILSFTMEEIWTHLGEEGSVHVAYFPEPDELTDGIHAEQRARAANWNTLIGVRESVMKSLETARQEKFIGAPLEAKVQLLADAELFPLLTRYATDLPGLFIVSQVELGNHAHRGLAIRIERAEGTKCDRCWKYTQDVGSAEDLPTVCAACAAAVHDFLGQPVVQ
jgi:isoleucyl-tRNA synthetase